MSRYRHTTSGDVVDVPPELDPAYSARGEYELIVDAPADDVEPDESSEDELKGKALDEALDQAGLPKSGTADEKRARLAGVTDETPEDTDA